jgi:dTDP-glucose 4,6-dehydratase
LAKALVTGGAGFLGSHLVDRLLAEGHDVIAVDNFITGSPDNIAHLTDNKHFEFLERDIIQPFDVPGHIDIVYNFASPASPVDFIRVPVETLKVGSYGTHNALALAHAKGARFLMASTSEVYGDPLVHPQPESYWGNVNPNGVRSVYDEAKRYSEAAVFMYKRHYGLDTKVVRIFNTYGPRMRLDDGRVIPQFVGQALRGEPLTVYGEGTQTRSFCYVSDLIDGIYRLAESKESGPINVGNPGTELTMIQIASVIIDAVKSASKITFVPFLTEDDPKQRRPDITKAKELLGWSPKVPIEEGIPITIDYFRGKV